MKNVEYLDMSDNPIGSDFPQYGDNSKMDELDALKT